MATLTPLPLPQSFEDFCALFLLFIAYSTLCLLYTSPSPRD